MPPVPEPLKHLSDEPDSERTLARIRDALRELAFGTVTITVHDGAIVQIDRTERVRLERPARR
jgi:hypothetical protein